MNASSFSTAHVCMSCSHAQSGKAAFHVHLNIYTGDNIPRKKWQWRESCCHWTAPVKRACSPVSIRTIQWARKNRLFCWNINRRCIWLERIFRCLNACRSASMCIVYIVLVMQHWQNALSLKWKIKLYRCYFEKVGGKWHYIML